ncbi:hypothetical protein F7734_43870 [Scytonema sp. UIC 10036]|uniref:hypothetical protein n=1 Tax=Scytonema sp. UIC 10036 TaxID=2304196 RepID=UPI0012DA406D|nr:hypothetical protein [Scytonema sp. UIC 10036]MUG98866.1 hypothetical protein [Scytonema sp. UIC 10036]
MRASEVLAVLMDRTVRYLDSIGHSVATALLLGCMPSKFKTIALKCEAKYHLYGKEVRLSSGLGDSNPEVANALQPRPCQMIAAINDVSAPIV